MAKCDSSFLKMKLQYFGGRGASSNDGNFKEITGSPWEKVKHMNEGPTAINGELTPTDVDALHKYHYGNAVMMNNALRDGKKTGGIFTEQDLKNLDTAINKGSLKENTVLFRGIPKNFVGRDFGNPSSMVGKTFTDKGYSSFTTSKEVADIYSNGVILRLNAKKGTKTAYVDGAIHTKSQLKEYAKEGNVGNYETLIKRGQKFKITGYTKSGNRIVYDCELA